MLDKLVDGDVVFRIGVVEQFFLVGVGVRGVNISKLSQTVSGTIFQYIDDTTGTNVVTTGTLVTTEGEFRVELQSQSICNLDVGLEVNVSTTYARTKDDTLVLTLGE